MMNGEPRTETERILFEIWKEVLNLDQISVSDNFFRLGGHSLVAIRIVMRARALLGVDIPLHILFEFPTIEQASEWIDNIQYVFQDASKVAPAIKDIGAKEGEI